MPKQAITSVCVVAMFGCVGGLMGCADTSTSGRQIIEELERSNIRVSDEGAEAKSPPPEVNLPPQGPITLADLLNVAEAHNPALGVSRSEVGAAAGALWQASLYPNPRIDALVEDVSWRDGFSDAKTTVGVTQPIILGNRRAAAMEAANAERAARLAEVDAQRRSLFGDIAGEYVLLVALREQQTLYRELRELAGRTFNAASARFEAKAAPETDVIRPRVELHRIDAALGRLRQEEAAAAKRLGLLLGGLDIDASRLEGSNPIDPAMIDVDSVRASVRASHPALLAADREIDAASARLDQVGAERTPDLDVRVAAGYRGESDDGIVEFGAGMELPLWDARQGDMLSARFKLMQARQQRAATENDLLARLATAVGEYEAARVQYVTFRDQIVPDAQRAFDQTGEGYRGGRSSFLDLLDSQRTLTEARVGLTELASGVAAARAHILQIVGPGGLDGSSPEVGSTVPSTNAERPQGAEVTP